MHRHGSRGEEAALSERKVALFLLDEADELQRLLHADAVAAAVAAGLSLETHFSGLDLANQLALIQQSLDAARPPAALVVMCAHDRGLERVARRAAYKGVHIVFLNCSDDDLAAVRAESPRVVVSVVCPDEQEAGRIQGRHIRQLVPAHGRAIYLQGRMRSRAARDRTAGLLDVVAGAPCEVVRIEAGWTQEDGREAVWGFLRMALRVDRLFDLVCCQNDALAEGAIQALDDVATELRRPEIRTIPVTGCDGSPDGGQALVRKGALRATIIRPRPTAPAISAVDRVLRTGEPPPPAILLRPASFPPEAELPPLALGRAAAAQAGATT